MAQTIVVRSYHTNKILKKVKVNYDGSIEFEVDDYSKLVVRDYNTGTLLKKVSVPNESITYAVED